MQVMNNFKQFEITAKDYLLTSGITLNLIDTLHNVSLNSEANPPRYLYDGKRNLDVVSMDVLARDGYKIVKKALQEEHPINTADAFLIDKDNIWYLIEFKDCQINNKKDNILKKAYCNWYMIMDIFFSMKELGKQSSIFDTDNPVKFAKDHVIYIVVCSQSKNPNIYNQIKSHALISQNYTPPFMQRLKDYIYKDVYAYTESSFEKQFVKSFTY